MAVALVASGCGGGGGGGDGEVFLEASGDAGDDPFSGSVALASASGDAAEASTPFTVVGDSSAAGTTSVGGGTPGLYGGTRDLGSCDKQQLVEFLTTHADKAEAWAAVQRIDPADIPAYVDALTAVVLRADTRVTNHGFVNGRASAHQSVLQAGTAVLVDDHGVPRARCFCGNPLLPPVATEVRPSYSGTAWPGFDAATVQVVAPSDEPLTEIAIFDIVDGGIFTVSVDPPDIEIHSTTTTAGDTPTTTRTSESTTTSRTGGEGTTSTTRESSTTTVATTTTTEAQCEQGCGGSTTTSSPPSTTTTTVRPTTTTTRRHGTTTTTTSPPPTTTTTACVGGAAPCPTTTTSGAG